jgi:hypothetical protein
MQNGGGTLGIGKHRKSGKCGKSPKARHALKREAEKNEIKAKASTCNHETFESLFKK